MDYITRHAIEQKVIVKLFEETAKAGWEISYVFDGEEKIWRASPAEAIEIIFSVDESSVCFKKPCAADALIRRSVSIVLGNDGYDCIADHSKSDAINPEDDFEQVMALVFAFSESLAESIFNNAMGCKP